MNLTVIFIKNIIHISEIMTVDTGNFMNIQSFGFLMLFYMWKANPQPAFIMLSISISHYFVFNNIFFKKCKLKEKKNQFTLKIKIWLFRVTVF